MTKGAVFSECRTWRYALWRTWQPALGMVAFIGLNPSTADETVDDPTIRRCIRFAKDWGYGGMYMLNLFAFRATDQLDMKAAKDPIGPANDEALFYYATKCQRIVACWGSHGGYRFRSDNVRYMFNRLLECFGKTKNGEPKHPLYLSANAELSVWHLPKD